jgi:biopolymer transport protein ExbD
VEEAMSHHGGSSLDDKCDPNLTPLLDVVLQLLMFFMMCVNFVTEQVNEDIKLPYAQSARPMDKGDQDVLFLNLDDHGQLLVLGKEEPLNLLKTKYYLKRQYEDAAKQAPDGKVRTVIVIRAHKDADYSQVYQVLQMCKAEGFRKLSLRAMTKG